MRSRQSAAAVAGLREPLIVPIIFLFITVLISLVDSLRPLEPKDARIAPPILSNLAPITNQEDQFTYSSNNYGKAVELISDSAGDRLPIQASQENLETRASLREAFQHWRGEFKSVNLVGLIKRPGSHMLHEVPSGPDPISNSVPGT